ncbi:MAG: hypothetical protein RLO50_14250 [Azospirillaceae bacterium]
MLEFLKLVASDLSVLRQYQTDKEGLLGNHPELSEFEKDLLRRGESPPIDSYLRGELKPGDETEYLAAAAHTTVIVVLIDASATRRMSDRDVERRERAYWDECLSTIDAKAA